MLEILLKIMDFINVRKNGGNGGSYAITRVLIKNIINNALFINHMKTYKDECRNALIFINIYL